jgi:hypothetical protein
MIGITSSVWNERSQGWDHDTIASNIGVLPSFGGKKMDGDTKKTPTASVTRKSKDAKV